MKIKSLKEEFLRHIACLAVGFLAVLSGFVFLPFKTDTTNAATVYVASETTLTVDTADIVVDAKVDVANLNTFFTATSNLEITTNNYSGYTLRISAEQEEDHDKLLGANDAYLASVETATSETAFKTQNTYIGKFGYKPSKLDSSDNTDYLPAPDSTGDVLDVTSAANDTSNSYEVSLAARVDMSIASGEYSNVYVYTVVANPVPYMIQYDGNTEDTVSNLPETQVDDTTDENMTLSDDVPTRDHYTFTGWCDGTTSIVDHADTCDGDVYQPGDTFYLDHTTNNSTTLKAMWSLNQYEVTVNAGNGVDNLALAGWTGTGTGTLKKTFFVGDTIDLSAFTPTYKTAYNDIKYIQNDSTGALSNATYTVGDGVGEISISAAGLSTPVCTMTGGAGKVYNRTATTITATDNSSSFDTDSTNITYSFGYATSTDATLGNFTAAGASNTFTVAKNSHYGWRYYGVKVVVTNKNDNTITASCTSGTGSGTGSTVANRATVALVNARINFDGNGGTLSSADPVYVAYQGTAYYTGRTNTTSASLPTVTPPAGYEFAGWYTAATGGNKVINADGTLTGTAVSGFTNASKQWIITGTSNEATVNMLYAQFTPIDYTITVKAGNGISTLALSGWTNTGTGTLTKTYHIGDTINLASFTPTYKTAYSGKKYAKTSGSGSLSDSTYTVGAGAATITIHATALDTPVCTMSGGGTKVYNYQATTLTATDNAPNYDTSATDITYSFGWASNDTNDLANFSPAQSGNTISIAKNGKVDSFGWSNYRSTRHYGVSVVVTDKNDSTITATCTSGTGSNTGSNVANRTSLTLVNARINFDATTNGGTLEGTTPVYAHYGSTAVYAGRTNSTAATIPSASKTGHVFDGWYTTASDAGSKVVNADGTLTGVAVSGFTNASKQWVLTSATSNGTVNKLYARFNVKTDLSLTISFNSTYVSKVEVKSGSASGTTVGTVSTSGNSVTGLTFGEAYYLVPTYTTGSKLSSWAQDSGAVGTLSSTTAANPTYTIGDGTNAVTLNGTRQSYVVTLNKNGATNTPTSSVNVTYYNTSLASVPTLPERTYTVSFTNNAGATITYSTADSSNCKSSSACKSKYTFSGWYKESGATTLVASSNPTPALQASVSGLTDSSKRWIATSAQTLYAGWTAETGTGKAQITLPAVARTGYTCKWNTKADGTGTTYNSGASITPSSNLALNAICTANPYKITLNQNNATTSGTASVNATYDSSALSSAITNPQRKYTITFDTNSSSCTAGSTSLTYTYNFAGWTTTNNGSTTLIDTSGALVASVSNYTDANSNWIRANTATAYAKWNKQSFTMPTLTRTGYTCKWNTEPDGTGTDYTQNAATSSFAPTGPTTLYAIATANSYKITLNNRNATTAGSTSVNATYDSNVLSASITNPTRMHTVSGFTKGDGASDATVSSTDTINHSLNFNGWWSTTSTSTGAKVIDENGALVASTSDDNGTYTDANRKWVLAGTKTLYSLWSQPSTGITLPTITKTGYTCIWTDQDGTTYASGKTNVKPSKNLTLTGSCTVNTYTITLNKNGATNTPTSSTTVTYGATSLGAIATRPTKSNGTATRTVSGWTLPSGNNANGATVNGGTDPGTLSSTATITYTFNGWHESSGTGTLVASSAATPALQASVSGYTNSSKQWTKTSNATLYAGWDSSTGSYSKITLPTITKTGYTCGWTTTSTGATTITYASGYNNFTPTSNSTTLYGVCTANTYTITLNKNGATNTPTSSTTVTYGATSLGAIATRPTKSNGTATRTVNFARGTNASNASISSMNQLSSTATITYTFNGWHESSGTGTLVASSAATPALQASVSGYTNSSKQWTKTSNTTLYAGWNSSTGSYSSVTLPTITKTGYTCTWNYNNTSYNSGSGMTPSGNITLTGTCTPNTYYIAYNGRLPADGQGGGSMANTTCTYDQDCTLRENAFWRYEDSFNVWNCISGCTATNILDKAKVRNLTSTNGATVTLQAQWVGEPSFGSDAIYNIRMTSSSVLFDFKTRVPSSAGNNMKYTIKPVNNPITKTCASGTDPPFCVFNDVDVGSALATSVHRFYIFDIEVEDAVTGSGKKALYKTDEFTSRFFYIKQIYCTFRSNCGMSTSEAIAWSNQSTVMADIVKMIYSDSSEVLPAFSGKTVDQKCDALYRGILGRGIDSAGLTSCRNYLNGGKSMSWVAATLANDTSEVQPIYQKYGLGTGTTTLP